MDGRVLGLILLLASALLTCNAYLLKDKVTLAEQCQVEYEPKKPCMTLIPRMDRRNCRNFNCCWIRGAPKGEMNCYQPYSGSS